MTITNGMTLLGRVSQYLDAKKSEKHFLENLKNDQIKQPIPKKSISINQSSDGKGKFIDKKV